MIVNLLKKYVDNVLKSIWWCVLDLQAGPRICLGKDFAYIQMKIFAAVLVRFFKFEAVEEKEVKYRPSLTLHMTEDGLNLRPRPRSNC